MKRIFTSLMTVIMTLSLLAGCSAAGDEPQAAATADGGKAGAAAYVEEPQKAAAADSGQAGAANSIMDVLSDDMLAVYANRDSALPVAVIYTFQGEGGRMDSPMYGEAAVNEALDAIADIVIITETDRYVTDSDSSYTFINADGTEAGSVSFNGGNLEVGGKIYEVDNKKALAAIDFPAETMRDLLVDDGPDPLLRAFMEKIVSDKPVAINVASNGSEYVITDADTISECISMMHHIGLTYAWEGASEPETFLVATFVMNDGTQFSLTLHDGSVYVYEFPQPLGMWSYHTDGAEYFIEALESAK